MPKKRCTRDGKPGLKWGDQGKCYTGVDKEKKVDQQRKAIKASQARAKKKR